MDYKKSWVQKNGSFWTVVLKKTLESPLDGKEIQPVHPKGNQFWVFIGRTDVEAETPIFWPPDVKSWLTWKDPDVGKDWRQRRRGKLRMRWLDDIISSGKSEQDSGDDEGQKSLECCCSYGRKHKTPLSDWATTSKTKQQKTFKHVDCILMDWIDRWSAWLRISKMY